MQPARKRTTLLLASALASGIALLSWTGEWHSITLGSGETLSVLGDVAAPALTALALTGLVLVGALAIASTLLRVILGAVQVLLGFTVGFSAVLALLNPIEASRTAITAATGVSGVAIVDEVSSVATTGWPWAALFAGALLMLLGAAIAATAPRWPASTRKYQTVRLEAADGERSAVVDWDSLSGGNDPTR